MASAHDVSVKGERDVVEKQSAALVRALDMVKKRIGQSVHDPVMRPQAGRDQSLCPADSLIEGKLVDGSLGNIKPNLVER